MIETILIGFVCVILAYFARYQRFSWTFPMSMMILFVFLAIRYNWGNDYSQYIDKFAIYNSVDQFNYFDPEERWEVGWLFLYRLFKPFGFFSLVIVLTAFEIGVYYWFIKKYVPKEWYWFSVFIFVFTPDLMLIEASMMRQTLAMCIVLLSIPYIFKKRFIVAILIIAFASLFHSSAKILLPIAFLGYVNKPLSVRGMIIGIIIFILPFLFKDTILSIMGNSLSLFELDKYNYYIEDGKEEIQLSLGIGFMFRIFLMCLILFYENKQDREKGLLFKLTAIYCLFIPLGFIVLFILRIGMYLQLSILVTYPLMIRSINNKLVRIMILWLMIAFNLYEFYAFFMSQTWRNSFIDYHTIFESVIWR